MIKTGNLNQLLTNDAASHESDVLIALLRSAEELITGKGWLNQVNKLLEEVGKATQVSRVWVFQTLSLQEDHILQDYVFEWASQEKYIQIGLPHFNYFKSELKEPEYISLIESRKRGEYQRVIVRKLPDSHLKSNLVQQKIVSMLTIPIIVEGEWWGTLGLDDCEREYEWSANEITYLRTASYFISSAITRDNNQVQKKQLRMLQEHMSCSSWEYDLNRGHLWITSGVLGSHSDTLKKVHFTLREWLKKIHPGQRKDFLKSTRHVLKQPGSHPNRLRFDLKVLGEDGKYNWLEVSMDNAANERWDESTIAGILWDITVRKQQEERLVYEATTDPLTGLINRRKIKEILQQYIERYQTSSQAFSLAMADIDYFKYINDTYGHHVGDQVLIHFTQTCTRTLKVPNYLARIGGEEFLILLPDTTPKKAHLIYSELCETVKNTPFFSKGNRISYSVSIGATSIEDKDTDIQTILEHADKALYQAKQSGRNRAISSKDFITLNTHKKID